MDEESLRHDIRAALDAVGRPAPDLLSRSMERIRSKDRPSWRTWALEVAGVAVAIVVFGALAIALHQVRREPAVEPTFPPPTAASPAARLEPGAQVAWLTSGVGIDPAGNILRTTGPADAIRSPDGTRLYAIAGKTIVAYSALTGKQDGRVIELASQSVSRQMRLSPDGRYLGLLELGPTYAVEVIDLQAGRASSRLDLGLAPSSRPELLLVAPNARELYVFTNLWRPPTDFLVLGFDGNSLRVTSRVTDGKDGHAVPRCNGLAPEVWAPGGLPIRLLSDNRTIVGYCPSDGRVFWFDLGRLTVTSEVTVDLPNPFWLSPVFSPDGGMLYLHEGFSGKGGIQAVDLIKRDSVMKMPLTGRSPNPLRWLADRLVTHAYAGGPIRTAAVSPDGDWLYVVSGGVYGFRLPWLALKFKWLMPAQAPAAWSPADGPIPTAWVSGDGSALYVLGRDQRVYVLRTSDGSVVATTPPGTVISGDFLVFGP